jgi:hypothetical protein
VTATDQGWQPERPVCRKCGSSSVLIESLGPFAGGFECVEGSGCAKRAATLPAPPAELIKCGQKTCESPAIGTLHWPGQSLPTCDGCAERAGLVAAAMGISVTIDWWPSPRMK